MESSPEGIPDHPSSLLLRRLPHPTAHQDTLERIPFLHAGRHSLRRRQGRAAARRRDTGLVEYRTIQQPALGINGQDRREEGCYLFRCQQRPRCSLLLAAGQDCLRPCHACYHPTPAHHCAPYATTPVDNHHSPDQPAHQRRYPPPAKSSTSRYRPALSRAPRPPAWPARALSLR
jgi:hypothetical protein